MTTIQTTAKLASQIKLGDVIVSRRYDVTINATVVDVHGQITDIKVNPWGRVVDTHDPAKQSIDSYHFLLDSGVGIKASAKSTLEVLGR